MHSNSRNISASLSTASLVQEVKQATGRVSTLVAAVRSYSQMDRASLHHRRYGKRGLVVLGFPMNDFGGQEPGSNKEISTFCVNQYAIDFPMFAKTELKKNPLYADLVKATGAAPRWNFHKYLIDRSGTKVASFDTRVTPDDAKLVAEIEKLLK